MQFIDVIYVWNAPSLLKLVLFVLSFMVFIVNDAFHADLFCLRYAYVSHFFILQGDYKPTISGVVGNIQFQISISCLAYTLVVHTKAYEFCSHHPFNNLNQQGCWHLVMLVLFVQSISRGFSPWLIIWHVNCTTCHVTMQQQQWRPPSRTTPMWTPLICCTVQIIALSQIWEGQRQRQGWIWQRQTQGKKQQINKDKNDKNTKENNIVRDVTHLRQ